MLIRVMSVSEDGRVIPILINTRHIITVEPWGDQPAPGARYPDKPYSVVYLDAAVHGEDSELYVTQLQSEILKSAQSF